jgi:hypothetical protein
VTNFTVRKIQAYNRGKSISLSKLKNVSVYFTASLSIASAEVGPEGGGIVFLRNVCSYIKSTRLYNPEY